MRIPANLSIRFPSCHKCQFAMRLQPHNSVKHLHACFLQVSCPANVRGFVEPRLQLHHHRHFLLRGRVDQRPHDRRIFARAIKRLFDRKYIRILRRALDETHHRRIRIVRVMQEHATLSNGLENRRRTLLERELAGYERLELQVRTRRLVVHMKQPRQVRRAIYVKHLPRFQPEISL